MYQHIFIQIILIFGAFAVEIHLSIRLGQFHGKVDMALKFQVYHITKQLLIMFYPYVEVKETERILQIGRIFSDIIANNVKKIFSVIQTGKMYT